jgi:SOS-response transcriptional repressor LexA
MAGVIAINSGLKAEFVVLSLAPPQSPQIPFGILLFDPLSESLRFKFREDIDELGLTPEDEEYVSFLQSDFDARSNEAGAAVFLASLEDSLSGFVRISEREMAYGRNPVRLLDRLFDAHIDSRVKPFVTHLPFYGLRAAATKFGEDMEVSESDVEWVRMPPGVSKGLRPSPDLFAVRVVGRSMEPLIPDGSLAVFRRIPAGSRQGKRLLIEELGVTDTSARFTVKKYSSVKRVKSDRDVDDQDAEWEHAAIRLEPLNPEFPSFELDPQSFENRYRVLGEFVAVLPADEDD